LKAKKAQLKRLPVAGIKKQTGASVASIQHVFEEGLPMSTENVRLQRDNAVDFAMSTPDLRELPLGLRLNYTDSFTKDLRQLECVVDSSALRAATRENNDRGTYPSATFGPSMSIDNGDDMDALDYVLMNSSEFGGAHDEAFFDSLS
jgi:hypothetical protein